MIIMKHFTLLLCLYSYIYCKILALILLTCVQHDHPFVSMHANRHFVKIGMNCVKSWCGCMINQPGCELAWVGVDLLLINTPLFKVNEVNTTHKVGTGAEACGEATAGKGKW